MLISEGNFLVAEQLRGLVREEGGLVVGPVATSRMACALIVSRALNGALLDINLELENSSPSAQLLEERHIPFLIVTGNERDFVSGRFPAAAYVGKPFCEKALVAPASEAFGTA